MSKGVTVLRWLALAVSVLGCAHTLPPPCVGEQCRNWPHLELRFWRGHPGNAGRRYTGALCVQVAYDCPEEGRHDVWMEPSVSRCRTYINTEGPEWFRVENGRLAIPWPARCRGDRVEVYVSAQPNFTVCNALNNQMVVANRSTLAADVSFDCR